MRPILLLFVGLLGTIPLSAYASLHISEVAWMGSTVSANHEWIELANSSDLSVSVDGYTLTDGASLSITLAGSIPGGGYGVLERTSDESAPGTALLVYTGALVNTGTTLTLRDGQGAIVDQVVGGENWSSIGGDNVTKDTAQYSGSAWITAPATPGRVNATVGTLPSTTPTPTSTAPPRSGSSVLLPRADKKTAPLTLANTALLLTISAPDVVYVGQKTSFSVQGEGPHRVVLDSLQFAWNFGNFSTSSGRVVTHRFAEPGEYVVTVAGSYGRHAQVARHTITVLPVMLTLTLSPEGNVMLHNNAPYEMLIGEYEISTGATTVTVPPHTVLLPRATIAIPDTLVSARTNQPVVVRNPHGAVVATSEVIPEEFTDEDINRAEAMPVTVFTEGTVMPSTVYETDVVDSSVKPTISELPTTTQHLVVPVLAAEKNPHTTTTLTFADRALWGFVLILLIALGALMLTRTPRPTQTMIVDHTQRE
jgi:hypothetical protein